MVFLSSVYSVFSLTERQVHQVSGDLNATLKALNDDATPKVAWETRAINAGARRRIVSTKREQDTITRRCGSNMNCAAKLTRLDFQDF